MADPMNQTAHNRDTSWWSRQWARWRAPIVHFPAPAAGTPLDDLRLLAVDMEVTDIDPRRGRIVSIGWVPVEGRTISLSGAQYFVVQGTDVGESATIHGITDSDTAAGVEEEEAIDALLQALQGRVLLAHFAELERSYLETAVLAHYGKKLRLPVADTFALERRHMEKMGTYPRGEDLRLATVRRRYGLPEYRNHNALTDALACAELYLAVTAQSRSRTWGSLPGTTRSK